MRQKALSGMMVACLLILLFNTFQNSKVHKAMEVRPERAKHGQVLKSHGVETERWLDESVAEVAARHIEQIKAKEKAEREAGLEEEK